jgi:hypothetical protein
MPAPTQKSGSTLLADLRSLITRCFPDGNMDVPYETWLWTATRDGAAGEQE